MRSRGVCCVWRSLVVGGTFVGGGVRVFVEGGQPVRQVQCVAVRYLWFEGTGAEGGRDNWHCVAAPGLPQMAHCACLWLPDRQLSASRGANRTGCGEVIRQFWLLGCCVGSTAAAGAIRQSFGPVCA
jgi:hypothetical protein